MDLLTSDIDQSYNYVIRNGFELNQNFYNCSGIDGFKLGVSRPYIGGYFLTVGIVLMMIYVPCLIVICKSDLMKSSCYKIMVWLGILDICCIFVNSIATGFLGIKGATLCSYPLFILSMGALGCGCWMGSCATCVLLGINRCCDVNHNLKMRTIFIGKKFYLTLSVPIIYTIYAIFFTKTASFNSNYISWFFNPLLPNGREATDYVNIQHAINNCIVSGATTAIYVYLCVILFAKSRFIRSESMSKTQKQIFFQSVLICSFNAIAAYIYVYMQFFSASPLVILVGQIGWQWSHGSVCLIYITMNRTVRRGFIDLFVPLSIRTKHKIGTYRKEVNLKSLVGTEGKSIAPTQGTSSESYF
ncbi:Serpentine Receptor, class T [Caenorhabditis elegans]|uniref:Serpentine Receptor, class T n=1 Tax=Caenorhabditis elegans TaxID=6239 RepID=Q95XW0_CAEEL|nr:Serpentine Receptor, class T [Caenorhabditis elegans]CCD70965.2 Serpentine Receptor, class T [Caenorhabditis elegans]|eukprot:NP_499976.3 Serpentine Receptor, class T [Caenorhabditis elegans]